MSDSELEEHRGYLSDGPRIAAYRAALAEVVGPDDVVLDLGSGTGVLGLLACEAGAKSIVAIDAGDIIDLAQKIAAANGYADRVRHIQAVSTETTLDPLADVVVCDQIGGLVHDAGILRYFADAKRRLTTPDARFVPAAFDIFAAPVTFDIARDAIAFWSSTPAGIDVRAAHERAINTEWRYWLTASNVVRLADGAPLASFPSYHDDAITGQHEYVVSEANRFDGWLGWFVAEMSPSVRMTNSPWAEDRIQRWCSFLPFDEPCEVDAGDTLSFELDIRPRIGTVSWRTTIATKGRPPRTVQQSTFNGQLLSRNTIASRITSVSVERTPRADTAAAILALIDGSRSQDDIVNELLQRGDSGFVDRAALEAFVRRVVRIAT